MEPDNLINPITNSTLVPPTRENEKDNIVSLNVPPSVTEIELSFNSKDPPPHAEDEGNRPFNLKRLDRLIIKLNVFNNPLKNNTPSNNPSITETDPPNEPPSNEPPSITEIDPHSNEPPSITETDPPNEPPSNEPPSITEIDPRSNEPPSITETDPPNEPPSNEPPSITEIDPHSNEPSSITEIDNRLLKAAISGNSSDLNRLVLQNPEVDLLGTTPQNNTCLHISSLFGHENFCTDVLARNQSLLSEVNTYGETPLIVSVTSGHVSLASVLLRLYQQLNLSGMILKPDNNGDNALHHAIRNGHIELALVLITAQPLLSHGVNKYKESPMYMAVLSDFFDVLEKLLEIPLSSHVGTNKENALHAAVRNGRPG